MNAGVVTLMFTDLTDSTRLAQVLGDDRAQALRLHHLQAIRDIADAHGGRQVKALGDGLMIAFDSPSAAVASAVAMQQKVDLDNRRGGEQLLMRVGINVGDAIPDEDDFWGTAVVIASRLCDHAQGGQIVASELVARLVGSRGGHTFEAPEPLYLKGIDEPVPACRVAWERLSDTPAPLPSVLTDSTTAAGNGRDAVPFVGRDGALGVLLGHLELAAAGSPQFVVIAGEAGIGKTRLAAEFCRRAHGDGATILFGRCFEESPVSYQPFAEALTQYVTGCPSAQLSLQVGARGGELQRIVPALAAHLPDRLRVVAGDPDGERFRLFDAVAAFITEIARQRPLVILLDDVQWADTPTLLMLRHLSRTCSAAQLMLVLTDRSGEAGRAGALEAALAEMDRTNRYRRITLSGLTRDEVGTLVTLAAGGDGDPDLTPALHEETEGNPFFVVEVLRHLVEVGVLSAQPGDAKPRRSVRDVGIPESVKLVIQRRLSHLDADTVEALRLAAIIGREFDFQVLEVVAGQQGEALARSLEQALEARLIGESPGAFGRFTFAHALVRETLYDGLSVMRRVLIHRRIAEAMEQLYAPTLARHLPELAHHFLESARGSDPTRAVQYAMRAGHQAAESVGYEDAVRYYERALAILEEGRGTRVDECELLIALGESQWSAGELESAKRAFERAADVATELGSAERLARAALGRGGRYSAVDTGTVDEPLIRLLDRALVALDDRDRALRARVMARLAEALTFSEERGRCAELAAAAIAMARHVGDKAALADVLNRTLWATWGPDNVNHRLTTAAECIQLADETGEMRIAAQGHVRRLADLLEVGDVDAADREAEVHQRRALALREPYSMWVAAVVRAMRAMLEGRFEAAAELAHEAVTVGQGSSNTNAAQLYGAQMVFLGREVGRLDTMVDGVAAMAERFPRVPGWRAILAYTCAELDRRDDARRELDRLAAADFADIPRDMFWLAAMSWTTEAVWYLTDRDRATILLGLLAPYSHRSMVLTPGSHCGGSVSRSLGQLATVAGRLDEAERHFDAALEANTRLRSRAWVAHTQHEYGLMLRQRGHEGDADRAAEMLAAAAATAAELGMTSLHGRCAALIG